MCDQEQVVSVSQWVSAISYLSRTRVSRVPSKDTSSCCLTIGKFYLYSYPFYVLLCICVTTKKWFLIQ